MDNKNVIIIILAIVLVVIAVGCLYFVSMPTAGDNNHVNETNITNNVTNVSQEDNQISTSSDNSGKSYGSQKEYDTGEYDEHGNSIYRSVFSTSGGQYNPGIYESYWSSSGPISEERIG